jgi:dTMP kinase
LEAEPLVFHERIRQEFLQLALLDPERYLVIDGRKEITEIHAEIVQRVGEIPTLHRNIRDADGNRLMKPIRRAANTARNTARKTVKKK